MRLRTKRVADLLNQVVRYQSQFSFFFFSKNFRIHTNCYDRVGSFFQAPRKLSLIQMRGCVLRKLSGEISFISQKYWRAIIAFRWPLQTHCLLSYISLRKFSINILALPALIFFSCSDLSEMRKSEKPSLESPDRFK